MSDTAAGEKVGPIFVSVKQAGQILGISTWSCYQLLNENKVDSRYHGRRRLVSVKSLEEYARNLPTSPTDGGGVA